MGRRKKDNCQFCLGAKGGKPGNEINVNGVMCCDECLFLVQAIRRGAASGLISTVGQMVTVNRLKAKAPKARKAEEVAANGTTSG